MDSESSAGSSDTDLLGGIRPYPAWLPSVSRAREGGPLRLLATTMLFGAVTLSGLGQASAQQEPASAEIALDTVTIEAQGERAGGPVRGYVARRSATATKTDTPVLETPQSISVVPRDQIEAQGAQSVSQALRYTPGTVPDQRPSSRYDIIPLRGVGNLQSFVHYLDGLKLQRGISYAVPVVDPYGLERIEVLRGPASVLFGQINPGGFVNLVSKKPTEAPFGEVQFQTGNGRRLQSAFDIGGPVGSDGSLFYRLTGLARRAETQVDHVDEERAFIAPALAWRPDTDTTLTILGTYLADPKSSYSLFLPPKGTALDNPNGRIPTSFYGGDPGYDQFDRKQASAGYLFEHRFNDTWLVRQNLRYMRLETDFFGIAPQTLAADDRTIMRTKSHTTDVLDSFAVDTQAQADFDTGPLHHTLLFGLDYQYADAGRWTSGGGPAAAAPPIDYLNPTYFLPIAAPAFATYTQRDSSQTGLYAQDQMKFGNFVLTLGGRHDWADTDTDTTTLATQTTVAAKQDDRAFTGRAGLTYLFENGLAPYASYATSFDPALGTDFFNDPFEPTTGEQYEVGVKYQPPGFNGFISVAAYDLRQQNVLTNDLEHTGYSVQTGEVHSRGIEVEARASLNESLDLVAAYTYVDAKVTESNDIDLGKVPTGVPTHAAALWANYTFHGGSLAGLSLGAGVRYVGSTFGDKANSYTVAPYTLLDAAIAYDLGAASPRLKGWKAALNAQNLFDKEYVASCATTSGPNSGCYYGLRRTVLATLTYRW